MDGINMDNLFKVACGVFDSQNYERASNNSLDKRETYYFENDVQRTIDKDISSRTLKREIGVISGKSLFDNENKIQQKRIDLGFRCEHSQYSSLVEIKIIERYSNNADEHIFPYIFGTSITENINFSKKSERGITYIEDIQEGQIFKDIVKVLEFKKNKPSCFSENCNNYVLFYILTDEENDAHNYQKLEVRLYDLFQRFDEISKKRGMYSVEITSGKDVTSSFTPLFYKTFFRYLGVKDVKHKNHQGSYSGNHKHISTVLVKFQEANEFGFDFQVA